MNFPPDTICDTRFRIVRPIRSGGMGSVFLAEQLDLQRNVALKFLLPDVDIERGFKRFRREAKVLSLLHHPNIVMIHCFGRWNELFYISMEYIEAESIEDMVLRSGKLPFDTISKVIQQVCSALGHAHKHDVVHRDIKPSNILVTAGGDVKLIDFGLSKAVQTGSQELTEPGSAVGTISFMSPEQCTAAEVDWRSDIYSLGCVLHYMCVGKPPFTDFNPLAIMEHHVEHELPRLPADTEERDKLQTVIDRATQKDPAMRYQSVSELLSDLGGTPVRMLISRKRKKLNFKSLRPLLLLVALLPLLVLVPFLLTPRATISKDMPLARLELAASERLAAGDRDGAVRIYEMMLPRAQSQPNLGGLYKRFWSVYYDAGQYDKAIEVAKRWIAGTRMPQKLQGMAALADSYREKGQVNESLAVRREMQRMEQLDDGRSTGH